jgi:hypothetical protein
MKKLLIGFISCTLALPLTSEAQAWKKGLLLDEFV